MVANHPPSLAALPAEMVSAVAVDAARDADRVALFLDTLCQRAALLKPISRSFLLHLGGALRLFAWEAKGFFFHRAAGLPEARQAIRDAFLSLQGPQADPTEFCVAVLRLSVEKFAWHGRRDLGADVALDDLPEDAALDALAEYLWASRRAGPATKSPQP